MTNNEQKEAIKSIITGLEEELLGADLSSRMNETGVVIKAGDGIADVFGLRNVASNEMIEFESGAIGVAFNLENDYVGTIVLGDYLKIQEGEKVKATGKILQIPVGDELIGRVVNGICDPIDEKGPLNCKTNYPVERIASGVITRESVKQPVHTGIKAIDGMIPIGRGQRELIIGDRQTGKTQIAIDAIINQKGENMICIYVAIGQRQSKIARMVTELQKRGAMDYTIIVASPSDAPAALNFLAPYVGTAIGEYFMDNGKDALIVYDDLSKHAVAYRQISLLMRRPPGREAFPGDVFYLHSRLLERSAKLSKNYGGGSLTSLPIIETQAGDVSAYIPTNVISITDGQIYLETDLFYQGVRPALNVGLSVSRVGSSAQTKAMKKVSGQLRLDLAQYRELASFAQFGSDLDEATSKKIERGKRMVELLKQKIFVPLHFAKEVMILYAGTSGHLDEIAVNKISDFEKGFFDYIDSKHPTIEKEISATKEFSEDLEKKTTEVIEEFKKEKLSSDFFVGGEKPSRFSIGGLEGDDIDELFPTSFVQIKDFLQEKNLSMACIDGRVKNRGKLALAGSGILLPRDKDNPQLPAKHYMENLFKLASEEKIKTITWNKNSHPTALYLKLNGIISPTLEQINSEAEKFANRLAEELTKVTGKRVKAKETENQGKHKERGIYIDFLGNLKLLRDDNKKLVNGFVISPKLFNDNDYLLNEIDVALSIAFGEQGLGEKAFSKNNPFVIDIIVKESEKRSVALLTEDIKKMISSDYPNQKEIINVSIITVP